MDIDQYLWNLTPPPQKKKTKKTHKIEERAEGWIINLFLGIKQNKANDLGSNLLWV